MDRWEFAALNIGDSIMVKFGGRETKARVVALRRLGANVRPDHVRVAITGEHYDIHRDQCLELVSHLVVG
jgi:hypothetical protein